MDARLYFCSSFLMYRRVLFHSIQSEYDFACVFVVYLYPQEVKSLSVDHELDWQGARQDVEASFSSSFRETKDRV